ncbi:lamin tail domain-containing protein [Chitinibacter bivalviorum]|uniref:Lamin tail domain-containing protein n=1 Tax=Chitinibacter bivalviorum TaxID=2739434 RepID=A0A7H9BK33_9NEIS|nr:lamin tail domain-containing protein [Chitinibacter bivalviorum]QLG89037.1 lamin tail domain-containing protein [Chitinibacter bivalviorum]
MKSIPKLSGIALACLVAWHPMSEAAGKVVISQVYGGGGNNGATYKNDFIELFNAGDVAVSLNNWSVQYASATGSSWQKTSLSGVIQPKQYFLVQQAAGTGGTVSLPTPDALGTLALSGTAGKVALVNNSAALNCGTACATAAGVEDFVGFGATANQYEGAGATAAPSNSTAVIRNNAGCTDSNNNAADFNAAAPTPRNSATPLADCSGVTPVPPDGNNGGNAGGAVVRIHDIQGSKHRSNMDGQTVSHVPGIVTLVTTTGFFMQDAQPDNNPLTSEGIFVYLGGKPAVVAGDAVEVSGVVKEYRPGGAGGAGNLTTTELSVSNISQISKISSGNTLPAAVVLDANVPTQIIWQGAVSDVEQAASLNLSNGLDYFESLEGMRVQVNGAQVVGPTRYTSNETPIVANYRAGANLQSPRGGVVISANNANPQRLILANGAVNVPVANVGDSFQTAVGVIDYNYANFQLLATSLTPLAQAGLQPETTRAARSDELSLGSFNVENLDPSDGAAKFDRLAKQIVGNLQAPDIVGLMEIQDSNGATNDAVVNPAVTMSQLINAIRAVGGPAYDYRQIDPVANQDGGEPGGNIRQVFLFNPARVQFVDRAGGAALTATAVQPCAEIACLSASPGRIDPTNSAFASSRKPLAAEFMFNGHKLFVIANHFNSKGGDQPIMGHIQPPLLSSEIQRNQQATIVADFVAQIRSLNPNAKVAVLGDLNDYQFSNPLNKLKAAGLVDLVETLPENERYTYVYEGNSQVLDHILATETLSRVADYDVVHVNSEFADQASDHEPEVARFNLPALYSDVSSNFAQQKTGLTYNLQSKTYNGSLTLSATAALTGKVMVVFKGLPSGVVLANAQGYINGMPYLTLSNPAAASKSVLNLQFNNPAKLPISYSATLLQAQLDY